MSYGIYLGIIMTQYNDIFVYSDLVFNKKLMIPITQ